MSATKFNIDNCRAVAEAVFDGLTLAEAAKSIDTRVGTVKGWLTRGRREDCGPYRDFAEAVDRARTDCLERELPMDATELKLEVSRAAKKGSVAAQKLYWEMLRAGNDEEDEDDPFADLDEHRAAAPAKGDR